MIKPTRENAPKKTEIDKNTFSSVSPQVQTSQFILLKILNLFLPISLNMCFGCSKEPSQWNGILILYNICFGWEIRFFFFLNFALVPTGLNILCVWEQNLQEDCANEHAHQWTFYDKHTKILCSYWDMDMALVLNSAGIKGTILQRGNRKMVFFLKFLSKIPLLEKSWELNSCVKIKTCVIMRYVIIVIKGLYCITHLLL